MHSKLGWPSLYIFSSSVILKKKLLLISFSVIVLYYRFRYVDYHSSILNCRCHWCFFILSLVLCGKFYELNCNDNSRYLKVRNCPLTKECKNLTISDLKEKVDDLRSLLSFLSVDSTNTSWFFLS